MTAILRISRAPQSAAIIALLLLSACGPTTVVPVIGPPHGDGGSGAGSDAGQGAPLVNSSCMPCVSTNDCTSSTELCVLLEHDSVCLGSCMTSADCAAGQECAILSSAEGNRISACVAMNGSCGILPVVGTDGGTVPVVTGDAGASPAVDAGTSPSGYCGALAGPTVSGTHCPCGAGHTCAANNCYNGWYCDTTTNKCVNPPTTCNNPPDAGTGPGLIDAGPGPTGPINAHNGGTTSNLIFAVVGDTRPGGIDSTSTYPKTIINGIYAAIAGLTTKPEFVVTTGDYMFASTTGGQASTQMGYYMQAAHQVSIPLWPALGNHECSGAVTSNCGPEAGNLTDNYNVFISNMMTPIGETLPYYSRRVDATDHSWTAKFIVAAPNAWGPIQAAWLSTQLSQQTTYTFVIEHESATTSGPPGISAINALVTQHPPTMRIVGHTHSWEWKTNEVVIGNGGAPLTGTVPYGYTIFERRPSDGAIMITGYDYTTGQSFQAHNVTPAGGPAP